jgi:hypothetical protein
MTATDTHPTIEDLLEAMFSLRSVPRLYNEGQLPLETSPLKIAAHAKQGSAHHWIFSNVHTGPRFAHSFQPSVCIRLCNKIVQAKAEVIQNHEKDKVKPDVENIRGLNLAVVKLTTVQLTKLPL